MEPNCTRPTWFPVSGKETVKMTVFQREQERTEGGKACTRLGGTLCLNNTPEALERDPLKITKVNP